MVYASNNTSAKKLLCLVLSIMLVYQSGFNKSEHFSFVLSDAALGRRKKKRVKWAEVNKIISDRHFRRMFRMSRDCFALLCSTIKNRIGESQFKSEEYISAFLDQPDHRCFNNAPSMFGAHQATTGGYISGEIKLAITLRLLAGGDALDIAVIFDVSHRWCQCIMIEVLEFWVVDLNLGKLNMKGYLSDKEAMNRVSDGFSIRLSGILKGAIGAIDGWLVKIKQPSFFQDDIRNIIAFFSRKGFYALNVQCIVDHQKKVLWASYSHKGASHDSSCFKDTNLYSHLREIQDKLFEYGYYLLGDSAYAIESFIIPPYDKASSKSPEDAFNYYHSSSRIIVECAFGEIDLRWGIFWKRIL